MSLRYPTTDDELETIVRDETSYDDTPDELPSSQLGTVIERAKGRMELETGSDQWYVDDGLGYALAAYACMRAKAAVENVALSDYSIGDEDVSFTETDPETSQQLQQWAEDVTVGLNGSDLDTSQGLTLSNSTGYIGDSYIRDDDRLDGGGY